MEFVKFEIMLRGSPVRSAPFLEMRINPKKILDKRAIF